MLVSTYSAIELCPDVLSIDVTCYKEANGVQGGNSHPDNLSGFFSLSVKPFCQACVHQCLPTEKAKLPQSKNDMALLRTVYCLAFSVSPLQLRAFLSCSPTLLDHVCGSFSKFGRDLLSAVGN